MIEEKNISTEKDYFSKPFKNAGFDKIPDNEIISIVQNELRSGVPGDHILTIIKKNASESNYETAQKIIEINELIGYRGVCDLKTFKGVDKKLVEAKRFILSQQKRISKELINDLLAEFTPDFNRPVLKKDLQKKLQAIYFNHGIINTAGNLLVIDKDYITQYFYISENFNPKEKNTFTLFSLKTEFLEIIKPETNDNSVD